MSTPPSADVRRRRRSSDERVKPSEMSDAQLKALRPVFARFDADQSGSISITELGAVAKAMKLEMSHSELAKLMAEADTDGSGEISFDEVRPTRAMLPSCAAPLPRSGLAAARTSPRCIRESKEVMT